MAYKKFPITTCGSHKSAVITLKEQFEPKSCRDLYLAEFQTKQKGKALARVWRGLEVAGG